MFQFVCEQPVPERLITRRGWLSRFLLSLTEALPPDWPASRRLWLRTLRWWSLEQITHFPADKLAAVLFAHTLARTVRCGWRQLDAQLAVLLAAQLAAPWSVFRWFSSCQPSLPPRPVSVELLA